MSFALVWSSDSNHQVLLPLFYTPSSFSSSFSFSPWEPAPPYELWPAQWGWRHTRRSAAAGTPNAYPFSGRWVYDSPPHPRPKQTHRNVGYVELIHVWLWVFVEAITISLLILSFSMRSFSFFCSRSVLAWYVATALVSFWILPVMERWYSLKSLACCRMLLRYS